MFGTLGVVYDQSFNIPPASLTQKNLPDQSGKVFIITGGYAGVGLELSKILYQQNATVYIAGRSQSKAQSAMNSIRTAYTKSSGQLDFIHVDLADLTTIKPAVQSFLQKENKLHWLNNNAGVMNPPKDSKGAQGLDLQYQTNVLGPFLFTKLLLGTLRATAASSPAGSVRVSWAGSLVIDVQSPKGGVSWQGNAPEIMKDVQTTYAVSKTANYFLAYEFGKRFGSRDGVLHNAYNPGNLRSELHRHGDYSGMQARMIDFMNHDCIYGAYTELYAGLATELTLHKDQGAYIVPWGRVEHVRRDVELQRGPRKSSEKIFEWCERETSKYA